MFFLENNDSTSSRGIAMPNVRNTSDDELGGFSPRKNGVQHNYSAVGGGGAAFHHLHTSAAPRHVASSEFYDDDEATSPSGGIEIGAGGGKMMANLRRHRQREREAYEDDSFSSSDESSGRPMPRYVGRDTDHVFGEFEMDDEDVEMRSGSGRRDEGKCLYGEDTDEDDYEEEESVSELLPLGGGTRRVPRTPRRKNSSKCGFFGLYSKAILKSENENDTIKEHILISR
ncbi:hypothetical protein B9Z55_005684 [Caenorhabditis nigoni]|uniref:Uncharacterized protein n=1 Tax=Caenorhabditis nigoni TaxID=1611254 RepID=A0A2G5V1Y0_9PELO|nr:hypothetical protein B9Z55_005684 [Caenorhabditis nigoni]